MFPLYLETSRLILREMMASDAQALYAFSNVPRYRLFEPDPPQTLADFEDIVRWITEEQQRLPRQYFYMIATLNTAPEIIVGGIHISIRSTDHQQAEIGYSFDPAYWGRGYCTEAARAMAVFAFDTLRMHRLYADCIVEQNIASWRVAQKLGMRQEAVLREALYFDGRWWNTLIYGITCTEWEENTGKD